MKKQLIRVLNIFIVKKRRDILKRIIIINLIQIIHHQIQMIVQIQMI